MFFLTTVDITIATTSLVAITADLGNFQLGSWILTSYQIGYVGKLHFPCSGRMCDYLLLYQAPSIRTSYTNDFPTSCNCHLRQGQRPIRPETSIPGLHRRFYYILSRLRCCPDYHTAVSQSRSPRNNLVPGCYRISGHIHPSNMFSISTPILKLR